MQSSLRCPELTLITINFHLLRIQFTTTLKYHYGNCLSSHAFVVLVRKSANNLGPPHHYKKNNGCSLQTLAQLLCQYEERVRDSFQGNETNGTNVGHVYTATS